MSRSPASPSPAARFPRPELLPALLITLLAACAVTDGKTDGKTDGTDSTSEDTDDTAPPCACDDGLYCNGVEACDTVGACIAGEPPPPDDDGDPCTLPTVCDEALDTYAVENNDADPTCAPQGTPPIVDAADYGFWYWPTNHRPTETWPTVETVMHFRTGYYGLAFDEASGELLHFGALEGGWTEAESLHRPNTDIDDLLDASIQFEAGVSGSGIVATGFTGVSGATTDRARMIDGGQFMNRVEIPELSYAADAGLDGRVEIASMPRHVVFTHAVSGTSSAAKTARVRLSGAAIEAFPNVTWLESDHALTLTDDSGAGWLFVVYDQDGATTRLSFGSGSGTDAGLVAERSVTTVPADGLSVSLLAAPITALGAAELDLYLHPDVAAQVSYTLLDANGGDVGTAEPMPWDETLGAYNVSLGTLQDAGASRSPDWEVESTHTIYGRHRIEVDTGGGPVAVPLAFFGTDKVTWYITGGVPILRDENGEPLGVPVQISKNWHEAGNYWYHFYSQPTFAGTGADTMELTLASSRWGEAYAASHAQLSLIGYGSAGGHWDESALGAFGESITYDPDVTLGRSMMDDVRPFLVQAATKWNWTGNVGGGDFLRYLTESEPYWQRRLSSVRSRYQAVGPVLTDVVYAGVSTDGRIQADVRTQLGGADDLVRVYYQLDYTFLEDVSYDRLAFFQIAADNYADNGFTHYAYGNAAGVVYDQTVPNHGTTGYASDADRGIALEGEAPWVMLYDNQRTGGSLPEIYSDVGFVVRAFEANIGGTVLTTPYINVQRTNNGQSQMAFELGLPYEDGAAWCGAPCMGLTGFIPAGSTVHAIVEYLVPPSDPSVYYGQSDYLNALPASTFGSTAMMVELAAGNQLAVEASVGTVHQVQPVEIDAVPGTIAAEVTLSGGRGLVPITFRGLNRYDGWQLQAEDGGVWTRVDQSVIGNDYWQTTYQADAETYALTFLVPNVDTQSYRLVWVSAG